MATSSRTVIVIGAARLTGGQCARAFVQAGWNCFLGDDDQAALDELSTELSDRFGSYKIDPATLLGLRNSLAGAISRFGRVDAVVHVPPLPEDAPGLMDLTNRQFDDVVATPARSITAGLKLFAEQMVRQRTDDDESRVDSLIQVFSIAALASNSNDFCISASQRMALASAEAATHELAELGVRTNAIMAIGPRSEQKETWLPSRTPLKRATKAEEIASAAYFLASPAAANMTGQRIILDGGRSQLNGLTTLEE